MSALPESGPASASGTHPTAQRSRLASFLFWLIRSGTAKAATVNADTLRLVFRSRSREIPLGDIEATELKAGWYWDRMDIRHALGEAAVSGLARNDAQEFAAGLEAARTEWWRGELAEQAELLRSIHERVVQLKDPPRYITSSIYRNLEREARRVSSLLPHRWPGTLADDAKVQMLATIRRFLSESDKGDDLREKANEAFVENELIRSRKFFDELQKHPLTDEQRRAIVRDEDANLVVAAAGSGKTSVMAAKVGGLLERGDRSANEILMLAFGRNAREEIEHHVKTKLRPHQAKRLSFKTFHALGLSILAQSQQGKPSLHRTAEDERAKSDLFKQILIDLTNEGKVEPQVREWFQRRFAPYHEQHEFETLGDYIEYLNTHEIRTLKGERVKSFEECEIANFLYLNGIDYEYEAPYRVVTRTPEYRQYKPDFHIKGTRIYIEHFGIDEKGNTAPYVDRERYHEEMEWKRETHTKHHTALIQTYTHEKRRGTLEKSLTLQLEIHGIGLHPIPAGRMFEVLNEQRRTDGLVDLVTNFLSHYKGALLTPEEIENRIKDHDKHDRPRARTFHWIFQHVYERYQKTLEDAEEIDFDDMVNHAIEEIESGRYRSPYRYLLVDEFQDTSASKARLLKALLAQVPEAEKGVPKAQLFAVGDDWQSIFRFAGAENAIMRHFGEHFGDMQRSDLTTTFRCAAPITEVATKFILKNPSQIEKTVRSKTCEKGPRVHIGLPNHEKPLIQTTLERITVDSEKAKIKGRPSVLLLGRYNRTCPKDLDALREQHPELAINYKTVHRAKGAEADYVVVLDMGTGKYGFPSQIADDPILDLVLPEVEDHKNAEERRLFYVALTRARRRVIVLSADTPSPFIEELLEGGYDVNTFGRKREHDVSCPHCKKGRLVCREGKYGPFLGCSNYPGCNYIRNLPASR